jgi:serine/threonine-protein kinase PpkA
LTDSEFPSIPGYSLLRKLGHGGMATVYLAKAEKSGKRVAIKVMGMHLQDEAWAHRFIREAQVIAELSHPRIVPVYDVGEHEGQFYIAMQYCEGGSLKDRLKRGMNILESVGIVMQIAAGLDFAGEKGFVHRDIKPDNIMFSPDGSPVILDFGIAKQTDATQDKMTKTGVVIGTTAYMSPEQAQGRDLDTRCDLYSLGVMFYEMLVGEVPYRGESDVETLIAHIRDPIPELPEQMSALQCVINKLLAKNPDDRYARGRELIAEISAIEPHLRELIAASDVGDDNATLIAHRPLDDATQAIDNSAPHAATQMRARTDSRQKITSEEDLSKVLSSAKATIQNFSEESRKKRARKSRALFYGAAAIAIFAVASLGYYQFYLIPEQQREAEAQLAAGEQKKAQHIATLFEEATELEGRISLGANADSEALIQKYREILSLEPGHTEASARLKALGQHYVELAQSASDQRDFDSASTLLDIAVTLGAEPSTMEQARKQLARARAIALEKSYAEKSLQTLVELAEQDLAIAQGWSNPAYIKLQQVLAQSNDHAQALALEQQLQKQSLAHAKQLLDSNKLMMAKQQWQWLNQYYGSSSEVKALGKHLQERQQQVSLSQQIQQRMRQIEEIESNADGILDYENWQRQLAELFKLESSHSGAKQSQNHLSDKTVALAERALRDRELDRAERALKLLASLPTNNATQSLQNQLQQQRDAQAKALQLLQQADQLVSSEAPEPNRQKNLQQALDLIQEARRTDPENERIDSSINTLESRYVLVLNSLIEEGDSDLALSYLEDTKTQAWPSQRLSEIKEHLQKEQDKKQRKRVITGGF